MSMKTKTISYLAITLIAVSSLFSVKAMALDERLSEVSETSQDQYDKKILLAKKIALQRMTNFMKNPVSNYETDKDARSTLDNMYNGLKNAKIYKVKPEFAARTSCSIGADFYVPITEGDNNIRICPMASNYSVDAMAQRFDHEPLHIAWKLMGIKVDSHNREDVVESEAYAISYEFAITRNANREKCIYMATGYELEADIMNYLNQHDVGVPPLCTGATSTK